MSALVRIFNDARRSGIFAFPNAYIQSVGHINRLQTESMCIDLMYIQLGTQEKYNTNKSLILFFLSFLFAFCFLLTYSIDKPKQNFQKTLQDRGGKTTVAMLLLSLLHSLSQCTKASAKLEKGNIKFKKKYFGAHL
mgnify:CR=1 FL=1